MYDSCENLSENERESINFYGHVCDLFILVVGKYF